MNLALLIKLITQLAGALDSKPGSKGRAKNLSTAALLGICSTILFYSAGTPEKLANLDKRLAVIEHELRISAVVARDSAEPSNVTRQAATNDVATHAAAEPSKFTFVRKNQNEP